MIKIIMQVEDLLQLFTFAYDYLNFKRRLLLKIFLIIISHLKYFNQAVFPWKIGEWSKFFVYFDSF